MTENFFEDNVGERLEEADGYERLLSRYNEEQKKLISGEDFKPTVAAFFQESVDGVVLRKDEPKYLIDLKEKVDRLEPSTKIVRRGYSDLGVPIAAKILRSVVTSDRTKEKFSNEAKRTANIEHPNIVTVYDLLSHQEFEENKVSVLIMRDVDGYGLDDLLSELKAGKRRLQTDELISMIDGVGKGMAFLQRRGLTHQDLHSGNIMFNKEGDVKIIDFGVSEESGIEQRNIDAWMYLKNVFELVSGRHLEAFKEEQFMTAVKLGDYAFEKLREKINRRCEFLVTQEKWDSFVKMMSEEADKARQATKNDGVQVDGIRVKLLRIFGE